MPKYISKKSHWISNGNGGVKKRTTYKYSSIKNIDIFLFSIVAPIYLVKHKKPKNKSST